ncbi:MAG: sigma-70 family RNA polymerase sigma factor [Acidimicrobiia bacterium]
MKDDFADARRLDELEDAALVVEVTRRRAEAVEILWRRHSSAVLGVARRVTQSPALAEEVLQEVFLRLWRAPERFNAERGALRSFLLMEANGRSIDAIRSDVSRRGLETRTAPADRTDADPVAAEVWDAAIADHLRDALDGLPDGEREAIELAYYGHHPYKDVAIILGVPEGTVKSRIRAGLGRLRDRLVAADLGEQQWTND